MKKVKLTIIESKCRCGYFKKGDEFIVEDLKDEEGNAVMEAPHPEQILTLKMERPVSKYDMIRKEAK